MGDKIIGLTKKLLPWSVTIIMLGILSAKLDWGSLTNVFGKADWRALAFALFISLFYHFYISVKKYKYLLEFFGIRLSDEEARLIKVGSMPVKAVAPYKAGEFLRAVYLKRNHDVSYKKGIFLIVSGYATRLPVLLIVSLTGIFAFHFELKSYFSTAVVAFLPILSFLLKEKYRPLVFYSVLGELFLLANYAVVFKAFSLPLSANEILMWTPLVLILTGLPVSVMGIGVREVAITSFFMSVTDFNTALSSALTLSFTESVAPLIISTLFFWRFISRIKKDENKAENFNPGRYLQRREKNVLTAYRLKKRASEVERAIRKYAGSKKIRILDIGAADGFILDYLKKRVNMERAVGVELFEELIKFKKSDEIELIRGKAENLPFGRDEFDVALICSVIEHVEDADRTLEEAHRVIKQGGYLILTSVNGILDRLASLFGIKPDDHLRTYTLKELGETLSRHKFEVMEKTSFGPLFYNITVAKKL